MDFIVSARKYRPQTFSSVVGQKALVATLKNAITSDRLASAYLFCGPRGCGKTTTARIFAKTINCENRTPDGESCGECESCLSFSQGRSMNIHELDAASNNSVDDIRDLIEKVMVPPVVGTKSVYIIDEVHMLSTAAFNAFLKTLEEPPKYAIFILATTEKHKVLPTILSRCQIYDFQRMTMQDTIDHLMGIAEKEGIQATPEALAVIAQKADGGMRDALSIFDQVVACLGNDLSYERVISNLGILADEYYFRMTTLLNNAEYKSSVLLLDEVLRTGFDAGNFMSGFSLHLRNVLMAKDPATVELLDVSQNVKGEYQEQAKECSEDFLYKALRLANDCDLNYRGAKNKRLLVELALIRICRIQSIINNA